jgi:hypothetical protein
MRRGPVLLLDRAVFVFTHEVSNGYAGLSQQGPSLVFWGGDFSEVADGPG